MAAYTLAQAKNQLSKLVDAALAGEPVTITRHGKPVAHLTPVCPARKAMTAEDLEWLAARRRSRPSWSQSGAELVREMRDEA